jgi:membrane-bound ClpP family serine protease
MTTESIKRWAGYVMLAGGVVLLIAELFDPTLTGAATGAFFVVFGWLASGRAS